MAEDNSFKLINTPNFFDEANLVQDQQIIDLMALSYPGPHLFLLAIDSENTQEQNVMAQVKKLQDTFGETVTEYLVLMLPDMESFTLLRHLNKRFHVWLPTEENLAIYLRRLYGGRQSFVFEYKYYSQDVVMRQRTALEKRR